MPRSSNNSKSAFGICSRPRAWKKLAWLVREEGNRGARTRSARKRDISQHVVHDGGLTMSWETRPSGKKYYYRSKRVGGLPRRVYVGTGATAELAALLDQRKREAQQADEEAEMLGQVNEIAANGPLDTAILLTGWLVEAVLI